MRTERQKFNFQQFNAPGVVFGLFPLFGQRPIHRADRLFHRQGLSDLQNHVDFSGAQLAFSAGGDGVAFFLGGRVFSCGEKKNSRER